MKAGLMLLGCVVLACAGMAEEAGQPVNLIVNGCFEEWEWVPLDSDQIVLAEAKRRLKNKEDIAIEHRGPLFRQLAGYVGCMGRMVEGAEAWQGKSLHIGSSCDFGYHGPFHGLLESGQEYKWEVWLKGKGSFIFKAWVGGGKDGQFKWLGFPCLIKVDATDSWMRYQGTFKVPVLEANGYRQEAKVSASIMVGKDSAIYIDNFSVWAAAGKKQESIQ